MEESDLLRQVVRDFSQKELARPAPGMWRSFDEMLENARKIGLFEPVIHAHGVSVLCHALLELGKVDSGLAVAVFSHWAAMELLKDAGLEPPERELVAFAPFGSPTESAGDSGAVHASFAGTNAALSGKAQSVVLAANARQVVLAAHAEGRMSYFAVPLSAPQVTLSPPVRTLGNRSSPMVDLELREAAGVLLSERASYERMHDRMALAAAGISLGVAHASVMEAVRYAKIRRQGGKEIGQWTEVKISLARMTSRLRVGELAFESACRAADEGRAGWERDAAAVLLVLQELACELTSDGIQILGGAGYTMEFEQEERFRSAFQIQHLLGAFCVRKLRYAE